MVGVTSRAFHQGEAERTAGRMSEAARLFVAAADEARDRDDIPGWVRAVLALARTQDFAVDPQEVPARLHELHGRLPVGPDRARVAVALARSWMYAGEPNRAAVFAAEAEKLTDGTSDLRLRTQALGAGLYAHSGPDDLGERRRLAAELLETVAHTRDTQALLRAHRWAFDVAASDLDVLAMTRHLAVVRRIGTESVQAAFFAAARGLMLDLLQGRTDTIAEYAAELDRLEAETRLADAWQVSGTIRGCAAMESGDVQATAHAAQIIEAVAREHGIPVGLATAALWWNAAGEPQRAEALVSLLAGPTLERLPRDANWLIVVQMALLVACERGLPEGARQAEQLLAPYEGRAVMDVGAVAFYGLTDDALARAAHLRGDARTAVTLRDRALATYRRIGSHWWARRLAEAIPDTAPITYRLAPGDGVWSVGRAGDPVPAMRGFAYLRELIARPGVELSALDLVGADQGHASVQQQDVGVLADAQALAAYRRRLADLDEEIDEAREWGDTGRLDLRQAERDALIAELSRATGLGGAARTIGGSAERARVAVRKAIVAAIDKLAAVDADVGAHLRSHVHTGSVCRYEPSDPPVEWDLG